MKAKVEVNVICDQEERGLHQVGKRTTSQGEAEVCQCAPTRTGNIQKKLERRDVVSE